MYLKQELDQQARQHEYQRGDWNKPGEKRELEKVLRDAQNEMDRVLSENSDLKSEIMRLQGIIEDERNEKEVSYEGFKYFCRSSLMSHAKGISMSSKITFLSSNRSMKRSLCTRRKLIISFAWNVVG
jgi:predicted RNase H-like nuclease (RuvC/YqgF family)